MRRVVSQVPSTPKTTWFSWTPSSNEPPVLTNRRSSSSARAGTIASSSGTGALDGRLAVRQAVRIGRRHHELAVAETNEDAGENGPCLVPRHRTADRRKGFEQDVCADCGKWRGVRVGQARKVLGAERVQPVFGRAALDVEDVLLLTVLERHLALGQQARQVDEEPARHDDGTFTVHLRVERCSNRKLHVRRRELDATSARANEDPARESEQRCAWRLRDRRRRASARAPLVSKRSSTLPLSRFLLDSFNPFVVVHRGCGACGRRCRTAWLSDERVWRQMGTNRCSPPPNRWRRCSVHTVTGLV